MNDPQSGKKLGLRCQPAVICLGHHHGRLILAGLVRSVIQRMISFAGSISVAARNACTSAPDPTGRS